MTHIDLVDNDWHSGRQQAVARVEVAGREAWFSGDEKWQSTLQLDHQHIEFATEEDATAFLGALAARFKGDYVWTTDPHDVGQCPFSFSAPKAAIPA